MNRKSVSQQPRSAICLLTTTLVTLAAPAVQAASFDFTYAPGTTQAQIASVEMAGLLWSQYLTDDVTVNMHFEMTTGNLSWGTLGGATPNVRSNFSHSQVSKGLLSEDPTTVFMDKVLQQDGRIHEFEGVMMTRANAEALGLNMNSRTSLDGYLQLNADYKWSYDYALGAVQKNHFDFTSVVLHEIGHNLGFISGIDSVNSGANPTSLDMFRYSETSATKGAIDFSVGSQERYFSLDGGESIVNDTVTTETVAKNGRIKTSTQTYEARFARGEDTSLGGDSMQASHWADASPDVGIMNPLAQSNTIRTISHIDLKAMDAIGWDVDYANHDKELDLALLWNLAQTNASSAVIQDRSSEVQDLIEESGIYNLGYGELWQKDKASTAAKHVPEPTSLLGLFSVTVLGIKSLRRRNKEEIGHDSTMG